METSNNLISDNGDFILDNNIIGDNFGNTVGSHLGGISGDLNKGGTIIAKPFLGITNPFLGTIFGTFGNDTLQGTTGNDRIDARQGNDSIFGNDGDDTLLAGASGRDTISGGNGNDIIQGNIEDNFLIGNAGADSIDGTFGEDTLEGGDGNDTLKAGSDALITANNEIIPDLGSDILRGGNGDDSLIGNSSRDVMSGDAGNDTLLGKSGNDRLDGGSGNDVLDGGRGNDAFILRINDDADTVTGGEGADQFFFFKGGSRGIDTITDFNRAEGDRIRIDISQLDEPTIGDFTYNIRNGNLALRGEVFANLGVGTEFEIDTDLEISFSF